MVQKGRADGKLAQDLSFIRFLGAKLQLATHRLQSAGAQI